MRNPSCSLALLASLPATLAANITTSSLSCYTVLTTSVPPNFTPSTYNIMITTLTQDISQTVTFTPLATITPNATTTTSVLTTTALINTTITSQASPVLVPARTSFTPFADTATEVPNSKNKRVESRVKLIARQAAGSDGSQAGFDIDSDGQSLPISTASFPYEVYCKVYYTIERISTSTMTASTAYTTMAAPTVTAFTVTTTTMTSTLTNILPATTIYGACGPANVVDTWFGRGIGRVEYLPRVNVTRQLTLNATDGYDCCASCVETENCAGAIYYQELCHITLSQVPVYNGTNGTEVEYCAAGSRTTRLGAVFTKEFLNATSRFTVINGYCGNWFYESNLYE